MISKSTTTIKMINCRSKMPLKLQWLVRLNLSFNHEEKKVKPKRGRAKVMQEKTNRARKLSRRISSKRISKLR